MQKKLISIFLVLLLGFQFVVRADEGMWLPLFMSKLNYEQMNKMGLKLTPEQLYNIEQTCLKDAIVMLDDGTCTAEMVSSDGLLLTNHHCGYDNIQEHSSVEHDYLTDGFWAMTRSEELANPGKKVSFLIRIEDVTARIMGKLSDTMSENSRKAAIEKVKRAITKEATENNDYDADVKEMFDGNQYFLFVYITYLDVRLVGAPPSSIGKFGGDTDNWMWPRHTGDFSMFRVYCAPDGKPAEYSDKNVPYHPKYVLPVSLKGVQKNDFAMIWGYPGSTDRYMSSYGIKLALEQDNPGIVKVGRSMLDIMSEEMEKDPKIKIQYSAKYAEIANSWKLYLGQEKSLKQLKVYDRKKLLEDEFVIWLQADKTRTEKYGNVIPEMDKCFKALTQNKFQMANMYLNFLFMGATIIEFAYKSESLALALQFNEKPKNKEDEQMNSFYKLLLGIETPQNEAEKLQKEAEKHFKDYYLTIDQKTLAKVLRYIYTDIPKAYHPTIFTFIEKKFKNDFDKYAEFVYKKSGFATKEKFEKFTSAPTLKVISKDPAFVLMQSIVEVFQNLEKGKNEAAPTFTKTKRLFLAGLMEMKSENKFYPDANSTMRVTYGTVEDYFPADGVYYNWRTSDKGIMEKEDPTNEEFVVAPRLKELIQKKDFGQYGVNDSLPVCFLTTNDITGGNSGSPVINGNGELIGIAFDGNWEAMSGDLIFEPKLQRTICVDIRYVLFVIDKYAGAGHLVKEMTLVK